MVYKRVGGWGSGRNLPVLNFVKYPPHPRVAGSHFDTHGHTIDFFYNNCQRMKNILVLTLIHPCGAVFPSLVP